MVKKNGDGDSSTNMWVDIKQDNRHKQDEDIKETVYLRSIWSWGRDTIALQELFVDILFDWEVA